MTVRITVDNRVRMQLDDLPPEAADRVRAAFCYDNPTYRKAGRLTGEPPTIKTWQHDASELSVPRGGMQKVRAVLGACGLGYSLRDARVWGHPEPGFPDHRWKLRDYQVDLIEAAERRQNCLLRAPTGAGKTTAGFGLLARLKRRALVIVWTGNLLEQWRERCGSELGIAGDDVGIIRGPEHRIRPVTLAMQQTIFERFKNGDRELADEFDIVLCDEVQRFAADTLFATVDPFRARFRVGVSAEETRKDEKEFLTYDLFGQVAHAVEEKSLIESGAIVPVEILVVPTTFKAPWYKYRQDWNRLLAEMTEDEERNQLALGIARKVVGEGQQVIMFTHRVEHARAIDADLVRAGVQSGVMLGGKAEELVFERTKEGLKSGHHRAGVGTYQAIAQGLDLPSVSRGICVTPMGNNRQQFGQVKGRICRASDGKSLGQLYYLLDRAIYGHRPIRNFLQWGYRVKVFAPDDGERGRGTWVDGRDYLRRSR